MKYVYIVRAGEQHYKVGITSNMKKRISALQTSNPHKIELVTHRLVGSAEQVERDIHKALKLLATGGGREWFKLSGEQVVELAVLLNQNPEVDAADRIIDSLGTQIRRLVTQYEKQIATTVPQQSAPKVELKPLKQSIRKAGIEGDVEAALVVIANEQRASTSLLQRRMSIGYGRASRIMDELENRGYVTVSDGVHGRDLIFT